MFEASDSGAREKFYKYFYGLEWVLRGSGSGEGSGEADGAA